MRKEFWKGFSYSLKQLINVVKGVKVSVHSPMESDYLEETEGRATVMYPYESMLVPEVGRYKLHNEIEDCIVCDKCADICPVDCIDIEKVKADSAVGTASDGTVIRFHALKFDIDMSKCCFCGLCTTVCPTECLTMLPEYDFSSFSLEEMTFPFSSYSEEEANEIRAKAPQRKARG